MHWLIDPIRYHYADFKGRASRREYWMFMLSYLVAAIVFAVVYALLVPFLGEAFAFSGIILLLVCLFGIILPSVAMQVRRLHDIGRSGWWYAIGFIPYVGGIVILVMSALPSQAGTNEWGPNPYGIGGENANSTPPPIAPIEPTQG